MEDRFLKRLRKKARKGLRGWPIATIAFYGPNLSQATKVAVGIVPSENAEVSILLQVTCQGHRTVREHFAHASPNLTKLLGTVHGLFRQGETQSPLLLTGRNCCFSEAKMVGAAGIEPATPTIATECYSLRQRVLKA